MRAFGDYDMLKTLKRPVRSLMAASLLVIIGACNDDATSNAAGSNTAATTATSKTATSKAATPAGQRAWTSVVEATPEGGFRVGNPNAEVKLVEFASLTCPHCAEFHEQGMSTLLNTYVASGKVSYELRNFILNGPDYAATLLARCQGPATFYKLADAFFEQQKKWLEPFANLTEADQQRLQALPADQQMVGLADAGGLDDFMRTRGMPRAKFQQCLTNQGDIAKLAAIRNEAISKYNIPGTPAFVINGELVQDTATWAQLEPKLKAAVN